MSYGKVHAGFWTDDKMVDAPDDAKLVALYLLSGPHRNLIGCFRCPTEYLMGDLKWPIDRVSDAILALSRIGFLVRDSRSGWTLICNQLKYDPLGNDKHAKAAARLTLDVPRSTNVFKAMVEKVGPHLDRLLKGHANVPGYPIDTHSIEMPSPEPLPLPAPAPLPGEAASPSAPPPPPAAPPVSQAKPPKAAKGSRLSSDWTLPPEWRDWTITETLSTGAGVPVLGEWADRVSLRFRDHWLAKAGKDGVKQDWEATWRNWVRKDLDDGKGPSGPPPQGEMPSTLPPEKRYRQATLDEQELARRVKKFCGSQVNDEMIAEWKRIDEARAA